MSYSKSSQNNNLSRRNSNSKNFNFNYNNNSRLHQSINHSRNHGLNALHFQNRHLSSSWPTWNPRSYFPQPIYQPRSSQHSAPYYNRNPQSLRNFTHSTNYQPNYNPRNYRPFRNNNHSSHNPNYRQYYASQTNNEFRNSCSCVNCFGSHNTQCISTNHVRNNQPHCSNELQLNQFCNSVSPLINQFQYTSTALLQRPQEDFAITRYDRLILPMDIPDILKYLLEFQQRCSSRKTSTAHMS